MSPLRASPVATAAGHVWRSLAHLWLPCRPRTPRGQSPRSRCIPFSRALPVPAAPSAPGPAGWRAQPGSARPGEHGNRGGSAARPAELMVHTKSCRAAGCTPSSPALHRAYGSGGHRGTPLQLPQPNHTRFALLAFPPLASYKSQIRCSVRLEQGLRGRPWTMAGTAGWLCSSAAQADPQLATAYLGGELLCLPCLLPIAAAAPENSLIIPGCPHFQNSPCLKGIIILGQTRCQSLAVQLPPKCCVFSRRGKQPKLPNLPKQQFRTVPVRQRMRGVGVKMLASCRLWEGKPEEEMITSAILAAITGM